MRIDGCWITKGDSELEKLKASVASVADYLHQVHITANHEHTKTKKWCEKQGYDFTYLPWDDDFSKQRNFNFSQALEADYVFWMDSDDILIGAKWLPVIAKNSHEKGADIIHLTYWYSNLFDGKPSEANLVENEISQSRERLINPRIFRWKGRLHETPMELPNTSPKHDRYVYDKERNPIVVLHTSAERGEDLERVVERNERNKRILEAQLNDERSVGKPDPRTLLYLMKIYEQDDDPDILKACLKMGAEYLGLSGWDQERSLCLVLMGKCYMHLQDPARASDCFLQAINEYPYSINAHLWLAESFTHLKHYDKAKHWFDVANKLPKRNDLGIDHVLENKIMTAQVGLALNYNFPHKKNFKEALKYATDLSELNPIDHNQDNLELIKDITQLNEACKHFDLLSRYLIVQKQPETVIKMLQILPESIATQPFAINIWKKYSDPRVWNTNEICYFANFGGPHLEKWDASSLEKGIGGSETAVIQLAREWTKLGYRVTVFGDPQEATIIDGVRYMPYYYFNQRDKFNVFIQWRSSGLAGAISAKKFYVDLHDVVNPIDFVSKAESIDGIFVKSGAHKILLNGFPEEKLFVISNGI